MYYGIFCKQRKQEILLENHICVCVLWLSMDGKHDQNLCGIHDSYNHCVSSAVMIETCNILSNIT